MSVAITIHVDTRPDQIAVSVIDVRSDLIWYIFFAIRKSTEISVRCYEPVSGSDLIRNEFCGIIDGCTNVRPLSRSSQ